MFSRDGKEEIGGEKRIFFFDLHSHRPRVISSRQTIVSVAAFAGKKTHARREFIAARITRADTDIATQSVIPPSIVGALLRAYVLAYVCSMYKSQHIHMYERVYAEKPSTGYADVASVLLAISEIASETRKSFIFFAVCEAQSANFPPSFSLILSLSLSFHSISPSFRVCTRFFDPDRVGHVSFTLDPS